MFKSCMMNDETFNDGKRIYNLWILCRSIGGTGTQTIPGYGGFTSLTRLPPLRKTTIEYYTPIDQPITESSVVK